jgi:hypothetical protein
VRTSDLRWSITGYILISVFELRDGQTQVTNKVPQEELSLREPESALGAYTYIHTYIHTSRDIFVTERAGTPFRKLLLRRTQAGTAFRNLYFSLSSI